MTKQLGQQTKVTTVQSSIEHDKSGMKPEVLHPWITSVLIGWSMGGSKGGCKQPGTHQTGTKIVNNAPKTGTKQQSNNTKEKPGPNVDVPG